MRSLAGEGRGGRTGRLSRWPSAAGDRLRVLLRRLEPLGARLRQPLVAAALVVALAGVVVALAVGGEEEGETPSGSEAGSSTPSATRSFEDEGLGVAVAFPAGWRAERSAGAVRVQRTDDTAIVSIVPAPADEGVRAVLADSVAEVRSQYRDVERLGAQRLEIAGRPAPALTLLGENEEGTRLRILVAAVEGRRRPYLINVFSTERDDRLLLEIEQILESLELGSGRGGGRGD